MAKTYLIGFLLVAASLFAQKTAPDLDFGDKSENAAHPFGRGPAKTKDRIAVIVQYTERQADEPAPRAATRRSVGRLIQPLASLDAEILEVTPDELEALKADARVTYISPADREVSGFLDKETGALNFQAVDNYCNNLNMGKGSGVGMAIIDSGIATHRNFNAWSSTTSRIVYSQSFIDTVTSDLQGHGTHVAGIAASVDNINGAVGNTALVGFYAPAMDANLINLRVLDAQGKSTDAAVVSAIDRAIALKATYNIRVINLSLGRPIVESYKTDPLTKAVERAWKAGIVVVVAAGNFGRDNSKNTGGYGTITSPGNHPLVITVGALNIRDDTNPANDVIASYSSKGPTMIDGIVKPDLIAPGNLVLSLQAPNSTLVKAYPGNRPPLSETDITSSTTPSSTYFRMSGTSMAAPFVAGAAATIIANDLSLTPDQVKARLMRTAKRYFPKTAAIYDSSTNTTFNVKHDIFTIGAGLVDISAAFFSTLKPTGSAASPQAYYDTATKMVKVRWNSTGALNVVWGETGTFASNVVWGENVSGSNVVWGENVVWGTSTVAGFSVVWGSSSPWSSGSAGVSQSLSILVNGEK